MAVAEGVYQAHTVGTKPGFGAVLRIEFGKLAGVVRYGGDAGDIMILFHRMIERHIVFAVSQSNGQGMFLVRRFRFKRRQRDAAAADYSLTQGENPVSAISISCAPSEPQPMHRGVGGVFPAIRADYLLQMMPA